MQIDLDLILAIAHHIAVFLLVGLFAAEFTMIRPGLSGSRITQLARIDATYGAVAALVIAIGLLRVTFGASGWSYYAGNHMFWAKMAAFAIMGFLTIPPTIAIRQWVGATRRDPDFAPALADITRNRRFVHLQAAMLLLIPSFAAAMARGYGAL